MQNSQESSHIVSRIENWQKHEIFTASKKKEAAIPFKVAACMLVNSPFESLYQWGCPR